MEQACLKLFAPLVPFVPFVCSSSSTTSLLLCSDLSAILKSAVPNRNRNVPDVSGEFDQFEASIGRNTWRTGGTKHGW